MAHTAYLPIIADRYGAVVRHIYIVGLDLTGIDMRAQVRLNGDVPGAPLIDLRTVTNGNAEGLRLVEVTTDAGVPSSHVELVINESSMEALPFAGEIGDATQLAWDWQVTIGQRKRRLAKGEFEITGDGVTGAEAAPSGRIASFGYPRQPVRDVWSSARLTFGEEQVTVKIDGADLVAPFAEKAAGSAAKAEADAVLAGNAAASAQAVTRYFTTRAAGESASAVDQAFATDDGAGNLIYWRRTSAGSIEIGRALTPAHLASETGSRNVGTKIDGVGAIRRNQGDRNEDVVNVWDFMTSEMKASVKAGNLSVDTAPAFQAAFDFASGKTMNSSGHGRRIVFRGGTYRWDTPVVFDWRVAAGVIDAGDLRRLSIEGDGHANTAIYYTGPASTPALTIAGLSGSGNGGVDLYMRVSGFWLRRIFSNSQTGTGILIKQANYLTLQDVGVDQFNLNVDLVDTIRVHAIGCTFTGANESLYARVSVYSHPNVYKFDRCDFGGNFKRVARFTTPANVVFADCGMEGNGDGTDHLIAINGGPQEGGCAFEMRGGYIENNWAISEVFLNWTPANNSGTAKFSGVSFSKTGNSRVVSNHILIAAEPPSAGRLKVDISGCAFRGFSYTPSSTRRVVAQTPNSANALVTISGCHFDSDIERPEFNGWPAIGDGYSQLAASVRFTAAGQIDSQWNVASVTKINTGEYVITYKQPLRAAPVHMTWGAIGPGVTCAYVKSESQAQCVIVTTDAGGAAADRAISLRLHGLLN